MKKAVFITGVAGFLGSHLAREFLNLGWDVLGIDSMLGGSSENVPQGVLWKRLDCRDRGTYSHLMNGVDVVYHCAAAPYEGLSVFSPQLVYENTLMSTIGVLREAINAGVKRFVFCSSMSRYGDHAAPFTEDMVPRPVDPYAHAKVAAENAVKCLCDLHGVEWSVAVPHNIYGPLQRYYDPFRNVAAIMVNRVLQGKPPVIYGDGSQRRCLSYIDDVTGPLLKLATEDVAVGEVFNVGPDDEGTTILELAQTILNIMGSQLDTVFYPPRPAEVHTAHCSADKARRLLGYSPEWKLEDGLTKLIEWVSAKGVRPFEYHLPIELPGSTVPKTWADRLM
jgi:UDP-glucose 4-epimerase